MSENNPARSENSHCTQMTYYGNKNALAGINNHDINSLYYCSTVASSNTVPIVANTNNAGSSCVGQVPKSSPFVQSY